MNIFIIVAIAMYNYLIMSLNSLMGLLFVNLVCLSAIKIFLFFSVYNIIFITILFHP